MITTLHAQLISDPAALAKLKRALEKNDGEVRATARELGMAYRTLQRLITVHGLRDWLTGLRIKQNQESPW